MFGKQHTTLALFVLLLIGVMSIAAASATIEPGQTHFPKGEYEVTADITFDKPVTLEDGAVLNIAKDVTVTFSGSLTAGEGQIFTGEGKVKGLKRVTPEWFGAKGDGTADDTEAFQKALDTFPEDGFSESGHKGNYVLHLKGTYLLSSVSVNSTYVTIQADNAWLVAQKKGEYPYLLQITKHFCAILGFLSIEGSYNTGYGCMINVNNRHFTANNVHIWRASLAWRFGRTEWFADPNALNNGISEVEVIGGAAEWCLRGIEAIGSNTIVHFSNVLVYSYPWTLPDTDERKKDWLASDTTLIRTYGGMVYYTGGCLANFAPQVAMVDLQPVKSDLETYNSSYGSVYICNTHIESGNFLKTTNPKNIKSKDYDGNEMDRSTKVSFWMIGCGGYTTGPVIPVITDENFTGRIVFENNNFYGHPTPIFAKLGNPKASIKVDNTTLASKWTGGLGAIDGGSPLFENRMILKAATNNSQSIGKQPTRVRFAKVISTPDTKHFESCYDPSTCVFKVPESGLDLLVISASVILEEESSEYTDLALIVNNEEVASNRFFGRSGRVSFEFDRLEKGDTISVSAKSASGTRQITVGNGTIFTIRGSRL